jgi:Divergent InlB B-repeat domain
LLATLIAGLVVIAQAAGARHTAVVVSVVGPGSVVSVPAGAIDCPPKCTATPALETTLTLETSPDSTAAHFVGWSDACSGSAPQCSFEVDEQNTVRATFAAGPPPQRPLAVPLKVTRSGDGSVRSEPPGAIDCGTSCSTAFSGGGTVQLVATPAAGATFVGWSGDCAGTGGCSVPVTTERNVTAAFRSTIPSGSSTITVNNPQHPPPGIGLVGVGDVIVTSGSVAQACRTTSCSYTFPNGTPVVVTGINGHFISWQGLCIGNSARCDLVVAQTGAVTVHWLPGIPVETQYGLNVTRAGTGRIASNPPGIDCGGSCLASYRPGIDVTLSATPGSGYAFAGWNGDCSGSGACRVNMRASLWVSAVFRKKRDLIRVVKSGPGRGTVESSPGGISCGSDCDERFVEGTNVTLRAVPDETSHFESWSGPCSGAGVCRFTVSAARDVEARFGLCASGAVRSFGAAAKRNPRRVLVRVQLAGGASARVRLRHSGRLIATKTFPGLQLGARRLSVQVPSRAPSGRYTVALRLADLCGSTRTITQKVNVPRP